MTLFAHIPNSNPGETVGLHLRGGVLFVPRHLAHAALAGERNSSVWVCEQLPTCRPAHVSEAHSSTEVIPVGYFMQMVSFLKCQSVISRMDHPSMPPYQPFGGVLVRHRVSSLGLFIYLNN